MDEERDQRKSWPSERIELLKNLCRRNWSPRQIADRLGMTRNAVIGKANRLGMPIYQKPKPPPLPKQIKPPPPPPPRIDVAPAEPKFLGLSLMQLRETSCRYPQGDVPPFSFCGQPQQDGSSYCSFHRALTTVPGRRPIVPP